MAPLLWSHELSVLSQPPPETVDATNDPESELKQAEELKIQAAEVVGESDEVLSTAETHEARALCPWAHGRRSSTRPA